MNLKNVATIIACFAVIGVFTACKKDGVYNPSKKISKIYYQNAGSGKTLSAIYEWDKNKLMKIKAPSGTYFTLFEYDGNRVTKIADSDGDWTARVTYDGSKFDKLIKSIERLADVEGVVLVAPQHLRQVLFALVSQLFIDIPIICPEEVSLEYNLKIVGKI